MFLTATCMDYMYFFIDYTAKNEQPILMLTQRFAVKNNNSSNNNIHVKKEWFAILGSYNVLENVGIFMSCFKNGW